MHIEFQAVNDAGAPQCRLVVQARVSRIQPAAQLEVLQDLRLDAGVNLDVEPQAFRRAAQIVKLPRILKQIAPSLLGPMAVPPETYPTGQPCQGTPAFRTVDATAE